MMELIVNTVRLSGLINNQINFPFIEGIEKVGFLYPTFFSSHKIKQTVI